MLCKHLQALEQEIIAAGMKETYRGQPWSKNCREWVFFDCVFDVTHILETRSLATSVVKHQNDDAKSGLEAGLVCMECFDGIMGIHPNERREKPIFG